MKIRAPKSLVIAVVFPIVMAILAVSPGIGNTADTAKIEIRSPAFANGDSIPEAYTCKGADKSPALEWSGIPAGAKSLALIVEDPDAPGGTFIHWVVYSISADRRGLPEDVAKDESVSGVGRQGTTGFGKVGYHGPCPPPGMPHHYHFRLYALDAEVDPGSSVDASKLEAAMQGHILGSGETVGLFQR